MPREGLEVVEIAALLHDIDDWKYQADVGVPTKRALAFLESQQVETDKIRRVMDIIDSMGFKEELSGDKPVSDSRDVISTLLSISPQLIALILHFVPVAQLLRRVWLRPGRRSTGALLRTCCRPYRVQKTKIGV